MKTEKCNTSTTRDNDNTSDDNEEQLIGLQT